MRAEHAEAGRELLCRYFDAVDSADLEEILAILSTATVRLGDREVSGVDDLAAAYAPHLVAPGVDGRRRTAHHLTNFRLVPDSTDPTLSRVSASYLRLEPGRECPVVVASGRIEQVLEAGPHGWQVLEHRVVADL